MSQKLKFITFSILHQTHSVNYKLPFVIMSQNNAPSNNTNRSSNRTNGKNAKNDRRKRFPYCGVCFKAGKDKSVYTSHWTRENSNPDSPIVCPLILSTVCGYCKETGHSIKYCEKRIRKNNRNLDNTSVSSSSTNPPSISKNSSRASLTSIDSSSHDNYNRKPRNRNRNRQNNNNNNNNNHIPKDTLLATPPPTPQPPSKWVSAVQDGDAMISVPPLPINTNKLGTFDSNGRKVLDEWVSPTNSTLKDDSCAPIMPLPPTPTEIENHIQQYSRKRIQNWADCDSDYDSDYTPISMSDLNDVSPYHIPSSSSVSSANDDDFDPEYESYLLEV